MACLGKICVEDPIGGCISGFDCPEEYNCVHPRCGSQLQTEFGICIPLAPIEWLDQDIENEKQKYIFNGFWMKSIRSDAEL